VLRLQLILQLCHCVEGYALLRCQTLLSQYLQKIDNKVK
jgi:hypothetical protein